MQTLKDARMTPQRFVIAPDFILDDRAYPEAWLLVYYQISEAKVRLDRTIRNPIQRVTESPGRSALHDANRTRTNVLIAGKTNC